MLRETAVIKTICMHGSPLSRYDSRHLWKYCDYACFEIEAEPYFDICLEETLYLTDTGRRWDGEGGSIRDRVYARNAGYFDGWVRKPVRGSAMDMTERSAGLKKIYRFRSTGEIITAANAGRLPSKLAITVHPQRWNEGYAPWILEAALQGIKNKIKYTVNLLRDE